MPPKFETIKLTLKSDHLNNLSLTVNPSDEAEPITILGVNGINVELELTMTKESDEDG